MMTKLDKKFDGHITKVKDGSTVPPDQWVVFLAKDNAFAAVLSVYRDNCVEMGCDADQVAAVDKIVLDVGLWRAAHPGLCKRPDAAGERLLP